MTTNGDGKSHAKPVKKVKETCPSFSRGHLPSMEDVERLRTLSKPHVDSFDYFLDVGLMRGIKDIEPAELDLVDTGKVRQYGLKSVDWSEVSTVHFWLEDLKVAKPVKSGSGKSNRLLPCECRERRIMYSGEMSGKFCYKITQRRNGVKIDGRPVKVPKTFGKLPIMVLSKMCHLKDMTPEDLVKVKEEVRVHGASGALFLLLLFGQREAHLFAVRHNIA
jgi:DNA-directed RNA polymerase beta subunit